MKVDICQYFFCLKNFSDLFEPKSGTSPPLPKGLGPMNKTLSIISVICDRRRGFDKM